MKEMEYTLGRYFLPLQIYLLFYHTLVLLTSPTPSPKERKGERKRGKARGREERQWGKEGRKERKTERNWSSEVDWFRAFPNSCPQVSLNSIQSNHWSFQSSALRLSRESINHNLEKTGQVSWRSSRQKLHKLYLEEVGRAVRWHQEYKILSAEETWRTLKNQVLKE